MIISKPFTTTSLLLLSIYFFQICHASPLLPAEMQIHNYVIAQQPAALTLLEKLVNINSGTLNIAGVRQVGDVLRPEFEKLGFKTRWVEEPKSMQRAATLVAERQGSAGKRLLLIGHLDTVFPKTSPFQRFEKQGEIAKGPGVIDDKGGDVVILYALKALASIHALDDATITVVLTGDEEDSGKPTNISRQPLIDAAKHSDVALDFEWSLGLDTATIARRGISHWKIETHGNDTHSAQIFQKAGGNGAIFELARILNTMRTQLSQEKYLSFNPGLVLGGSTVSYDKSTSDGIATGKNNVIAKTAMAKGDLRFLTTKQQLAAQEKIQAIVQQQLPGTQATVTFQEAIPAMPPTAKNTQLLKSYSAISNDLGYGAVTALDPGLRGAADISHVAAIVPANLAGLGPYGTGAHSTQETLDIHSLPIATARAAILIYRLTHETRRSNT